MKYAICFVLLSLLVLPLTNTFGRQVDFSEVEQTLRQAHQLEVSGGRVVTGHSRMEGDDVLVTTGDARIEYSFPADEVVRLSLPGRAYYPIALELEDSGDYVQALRLMDALYRSRVRHLRFLDEGELQFLQRFADLGLREGDPFLAVAVARNILPHVKDPGMRREVEDLILLGHYSLPIKERAVELAAEWISSNPPGGESALGYYVYGQLAFDRGEYHTALITALRPIAFSSHYPMDYLAHCYALAVMAWDALGRGQERDALADEMRERGFSWPSLPMLSPYKHLFTVESKDHAPDLPDPS